MRVRVGLVVLVLAAVAAPSVLASPLPPAIGEPAGICDPVDPAHCLLPFPSDFFTVADPTTATGRRVAFSPLALPTNVAGKPWDPTEWNRNDGFSPGTPILTHVPGLDLSRTWGLPAGVDQLTDLSLSLRPDAPIVLLDADTGERHPFWSELDRHPDTTDAERLLVIRPARNLTEGHRYVVLLRRLLAADGSVLAGAPTNVEPEVLDDLVGAGLDAGATDLYRAWDFTVASERNLSERVLRIRDDAFAQLGDDDLADGRIDGAAPRITVTEVVDRTPAESRGTARTVRGLLAVPNYLTPQAEVALPEVPTDSLPEEVELPDPLGDVVGLLDDGLVQAVPLSRFFPGPDGLPAQDPVQPTVDVPFDCHLPHRANVPDPHGRADGVLYGHGLLGSRDEAAGSSTEDLRLRGFAVCAIDWWGMSTADLANVGLILADMSNFGSLADRAQQGFLNFLYLGRALAHPDGFAALPAFQDEAGRPLLRTGSVSYVGNSQGAIMGGALTAVAPDFERAVLGVPGMNYSTLLNRSVDWEGAYGEIAYAAYPSKLEQQLVFGLIQMLWDRAESNGYAHHMTTDPLAGTRPHAVMLQVAYADHQVANVAAEVEARTIGARLVLPGFGPANPHWSVDPSFGLLPARYGGASKGDSVLISWYSSERGLTVPPTANVPPTTGSDPHGDPRKDNAASDQVATWLRTGRLVDACGGAVCVTTSASQAN